MIEAMTSIDSARRVLAATESLERPLNRRTSLVRAAARTEPVKKSPPRMRAVRLLE
jgi:hypothetical protein